MNLTSHMKQALVELMDEEGAGKRGTPPIILQDRIFISHQRRIRAKVDLGVDVEVVCCAAANADA